MTRHILIIVCLLCGIHLQAHNLQLQWVGDGPTYTTGTSWGVPFEKGKVDRKQKFALETSNTTTHPVQTWPLAFWPDGSVKWMGFAASGLTGYPIVVRAVDQHQTTFPSLKVTSRGKQTIITDQHWEYRINHTDTNFLESISVNGKLLATGGRLVARMHTGDPKGAFLKQLPVSLLSGKISEVITEQDGPLRAVIRIKGAYTEEGQAKREVMPFTLRLYFYQGVQSVKMVHSFVYEGDQDRDFIGGIGLEFDIPFRHELYNRHIGFTTTEGGVWRESVQPLVMRRQLQVEGIASVAHHQASGKQIPTFTPDQQPAWGWIQHLPSWNSYKLTQLHPGGYTIAKRTQQNSSWLQATTGTRSNGMVTVGDIAGAVSLSLKDFWQSYPASMEVDNARDKTATLRTWLWSPDADPMDLRHYDTVAHHLDVTYEDIQEGLSTPFGIARTHELTLFLHDTLPSPTLMAGLATQASETQQLIPTPAYMHRVRAFGTWSLPDYTNPMRRWMEEQLDSAFRFYERAIEEHQWYGFWNYGDVMHSYDASRNSWKYDIGGYAWANTELAPNNWLWYSFLRTGRADIFRMAEAMTRHTGEVDAYHTGPMKGLGTRHNVSHWGCGAKEARIGQAAWKRFYYYLTTDERNGDLMQEALDVEKAMMIYEPLRIAQPRERFPFEGPTRLRWGPDWLALVGNWMTEWERSENTHYRNKIIRGMESLSKLSDGLFTGPGGLSYDPQSGEITYDGKEGLTNKNHLSTIMGGFEILTELEDMIDHEAFWKTLASYGKYYSMPADDPHRNPHNRHWGDIGFRNPRITAYAAATLKDAGMAARAWEEFLNTGHRRSSQFPHLYSSKKVSPPEVHTPLHENPWIGTNGTSQWGLNAIILPELIGDYLPDSSYQRNKQAFGIATKKYNQLIVRDAFRNTKKWFADGQRLTLGKGSEGLLFKAGEIPASDADHSVIWTQQEFEGNLKIEFDYVRRDWATRYVNIIYLLAQGSGTPPYTSDIFQWKELREIPAMRTYFNHMQLFHVSLAAFENDNDLPGADYIRARRYLPENGRGLSGTELMPEYFNTGFFEPYVKHHITLIKEGDTVWMEVRTSRRTQLYHWQSPLIESLNAGRIGIRLMGSRQSEFSNFKVYQK
jgi:hypothetical protein